MAASASVVSALPKISFLNCLLQAHNAVALQQWIDSGTDVNSILAAFVTVEGVQVWVRASPLCFAAMRGIPPIITALIKAAAALHDKDSMFTAPPVAWAAWKGHLRAVEVLVQAGANIHDSNNLALILASRGGHTAVVSYLIHRGANVNAVSHGRVPAYINHSIDTGFLDSSPLREAARKCRVDAAIVLMAAGAVDVDRALLFAAHYGHIDIVKLLCERGASLIATNGDKHPPLWLAATAAHVDVVEYLLDQGASPDCDPADTGETPLFATVAGLGRFTAPLIPEAAFHDIMELLISRGATLETWCSTPAVTSGASGCSLLSRAVVSGVWSRVACLLDNGASPFWTGADGATALHVAAVGDRGPAVRMLLHAGAQANATCADKDWVPLQECLRFIGDIYNNSRLGEEDDWVVRPICTLLAGGSTFHTQHG